MKSDPQAPFRQNFKCFVQTLIYLYFVVPQQCLQEVIVQVHEALLLLSQE